MNTCTDKRVFQSTLPHGERLALRVKLGLREIFQSTPPHGERQIPGHYSLCFTTFQSTPPHGERPSFRVSCAAEYPFQSTPPHGERHAHLEYEEYKYHISIHAPAWGATCFQYIRETWIYYFNPRPRMGSDYKKSNIKLRLLKFQSTPPHGERHFASLRLRHL